MGNFRNITNQIFGRVTAIYPTEKRSPSGSVLWYCLCNCGNSTEISSSHLITGLVKSCGCLHKEILKESGRKNQKDKTGKRYGRLVVTQRSNKPAKNYNTSWLCKCDCGNLVEVITHNLTSGNTQSCGCLYCRGSVYLYGLQSETTGLIKIGITSNVYRRRKELENEYKDRLIILGYSLGTRGQETNIHNKLAQFQINHPNNVGREWFSPSEQVREELFNVLSN